jgi:hypothetical protein
MNNRDVRSGHPCDGSKIPEPCRIANSVQPRFCTMAVPGTSALGSWLTFNDTLHVTAQMDVSM